MQAPRHQTRKGSVLGGDRHGGFRIGKEPEASDAVQRKARQTGDMVKAVVPTGKKAGTHTGRVAVRKTGSFNIQTQHGVVQSISHPYCTLIQRGDGYGYYLAPTIHQPKGGAGQAVA